MDNSINGKWNNFCETVGGQYICTNCGAILTQEQTKEAGKVSATGWIIIAVMFLTISKLLGFIYYYFAPKKGCVICKAKKEDIVALKSLKGVDAFKQKHPSSAYLTKDLELEGK